MSLTPEIQSKSPFPIQTNLSSSIIEILFQIELELFKKDRVCDYKKLKDLIHTLPKIHPSFDQFEKTKAQKMIGRLQEKLQDLKSNLEKYMICLFLWSYLQRGLFACFQEIVMPNKKNEEEILIFFAHYFHLFSLSLKNTTEERYIFDPLFTLYLNETEQLDWNMIKRLDFLFPEEMEQDAKQLFEITLMRSFMNLVSTQNDANFRIILYNHTIDLASQAYIDASQGNKYVPYSSSFTEHEESFVSDFIHYLIQHSNEKKDFSNLIKRNRALIYFEQLWTNSLLMNSDTFQQAILEILRQNKINPHDILFSQCLQRITDQMFVYEKNISHVLRFLNDQSFSKERALGIVKNLAEQKNNELQIDFGYRCRTFIKNLPSKDDQQLMFNTALTYVLNHRYLDKTISLISANPDLFHHFDLSDFYHVKNYFVKLCFIPKNYDAMEFFSYYYFSIGNFEYQSIFLQMMTLDYLKFIRESFFNADSKDDYSISLIQLFSTHMFLDEKQNHSDGSYISKYSLFLLSYVFPLINIEKKTYYNCYLEFLDRIFCSSFDENLIPLMVYSISTMLTIIKLKKHPYVFSTSFSEKISKLSKNNSLHVIIANLFEKKNITKRYTQNEYFSALEKQATKLLHNNFKKSANVFNFSHSFFPLLPLLAENVFKKSTHEVFQDLIFYFEAKKRTPLLSMLLMLSNGEVVMNFAEVLCTMSKKIKDVSGKKLLLSTVLANLAGHLTICPKKSLLERFLALDIDYESIEIVNFSPMVHLLSLLTFYPSKLENEQFQRFLSFAQKITPTLKTHDSLEIFLTIVYQIDLTNVRFDMGIYDRYFQVMDLLIEKDRRKALQEPNVVPKTKIEFHYLYALSLRDLEITHGKDRTGFQFLSTLDLKAILGEDFEEPLKHMKKNKQLFSSNIFFEYVISKLKGQGHICISDEEHLEKWGNKRAFVCVPKTIQSIEIARGIIHQGIQLIHLENLRLKSCLKKQEKRIKEKKKILMDIKEIIEIKDDTPLSFISIE